MKIELDSNDILACCHTSMHLRSDDLILLQFDGALEKVVTQCFESMNVDFTTEYEDEFDQDVLFYISKKDALLHGIEFADNTNFKPEST